MSRTAAPECHARCLGQGCRKCPQETRDLYPPEWAYRVRTVVDSPAGSGRTDPGLRIAFTVITTSREEANLAIAAECRAVGHKAALIIRTEKIEQYTFDARAVVNSMLALARMDARSGRKA